MELFNFDASFIAEAPIRTVVVKDGQDRDKVQRDMAMEYIDAMAASRRRKR